jgi:hypothetical protein
MMRYRVLDAGYSLLVVAQRRSRMAGILDAGYWILI